jgi:hypothetical protein
LANAYFVLAVKSRILRYGKRKSVKPFRSNPSSKTKTVEKKRKIKISNKALDRSSSAIAYFIHAVKSRILSYDTIKSVQPF